MMVIVMMPVCCAVEQATVAAALTEEEARRSKRQRRPSSKAAASEHASVGPDIGAMQETVTDQESLPIHMVLPLKVSWNVAQCSLGFISIFVALACSTAHRALLPFIVLKGSLC